MLSTLRRPHVLSSRLRRQNGGSSPRDSSPQFRRLPIDDLWDRAIEKYEEIVGAKIDEDEPLMADLRSCETADAIVETIEEATRQFRKKREGSKASQSLRRVLRPLVHGLRVVLETGAETGSSLGIPGGKGIFAAIAVLVKAAEGVSAIYDDIDALFKHFQSYVEILQVRVEAPIGHGTRDIAVEGLAQLLIGFGLATKELHRRRSSRFMLFFLNGGGEIQAINRTLQDVEVRRDRMAIAELSVVASQLSSGVDNIQASVAQLSAQTDTQVADLSLSDPRAHAESARRGDDEAFDEMQGLPGCLEAAEARQRTNGDEDFYPSALQLRSACRQVRRVVLRFSCEDQTIIWRALGAMLSYIVDRERPHSDHEQLGSTVSNETQTVDMAFTVFAGLGAGFLLCFMFYKLTSIHLHLGWADGTVIVVDVLGRSLELLQDDYKTWETAHSFLVQAFRGQLGEDYVRQETYGLGDSKRLLIDRGEWSHIVKAGSRFDMSIIVLSETSRCPYCKMGTTGKEVQIGDGRIRCAYAGCGRLYASQSEGDSATSNAAERTRKEPEEDVDHPEDNSEAGHSRSTESTQDGRPTYLASAGLNAFFRIVVAFREQQATVEREPSPSERPPAGTESEADPHTQGDTEADDAAPGAGEEGGAGLARELSPSESPLDNAAAPAGTDSEAEFITGGDETQGDTKAIDAAPGADVRRRAGSSGTDYEMRLHNYLARLRQLSGFKWQLTSDGPPHSIMHYATATLNGQVIGRGQGVAKGLAKRNAAYQALVALRVEP
ncbi:unnamed protein product [Peniophora sp. CBMAI 1063]|nr:unnamed protein product [Peniophora sp. CBMAI 1063]